MIEINVKRIGDHNLLLPKIKTEFSAGCDLPCLKQFQIYPGEQVIMQTGFAFEIPQGFCGQIWPRSGLAANNSIDVLAGLIDSDYRGEIKVILINHGNKVCHFNSGDRIAQLVIAPALLYNTIEVKELSDTSRSDSGFGSTGK